MARTHEEQRAALAKEREGRKAAFLAAVEKRDGIAAFAHAADATDFDRRELARAEARIELARTAMRHWGDPLPNTGSTALSGSCSLSEPTGAVETVQAEAVARIQRSVRKSEAAEVETIARRILNS